MHISGGTYRQKELGLVLAPHLPIQCLNIGKNCMIGAGSVVVKDVPDNVTALVVLQSNQKS